MTNTESPAIGEPSIDQDEVHALASEVLDAVSETMPALFEGAPGIADGTWLVGHVAFLGGAHAEATIATPAELGARLALAYGLVADGEPELEDAVDAFGEFVNVMGGSLKAAFEHVTTLGIPTVEAVAAWDGGDGEFVTVDHPVGHLLVSIVTGQPT
jgi:hypothetical protein